MNAEYQNFNAEKTDYSKLKTTCIINFFLKSSHEGKRQNGWAEINRRFMDLKPEEKERVAKIITQAPYKNDRKIVENVMAVLSHDAITELGNIAITMRPENTSGRMTRSELMYEGIQ